LKTWKSLLLLDVETCFLESFPYNYFFITEAVIITSLVGSLLEKGGLPFDNSTRTTMLFPYLHP
jgi:hypothetical protein